MNERIKLLAEQAGIPSLWTVGTDKQGNPILEKFAELIVRECAELCTDQYHLGDAGTGDGFGITAADTRCSELIKKHFGVEE